jgi:CHAT domain-containing protein/tetratricopeptide (TPR) repeat protein
MSNDPKAGPGIDAALLAAYLDQRLSPEQRAAVEAQLASDPESYELLVEAMKAQEGMADEAERVVPRPLPFSPKPVHKNRWRVVVSLVAAAATIAFAVRILPELMLERSSTLTGDLVAAVGDERLIEARLTGGFQFGPLRPITRGPGSLSEQNLALLAASGALQRAAQEHPVPENLHAWGVAQVLLGDHDEAVRNLMDATRERPSEGSWFSDLSAAYLARARVLERAEDWPRALEAAERALQVNPNLPEALFNRALALESLQLDRQAEEAWRTYLEKDPDSQWATEAESHLSALSQPKAERSWDDEQPRLVTANASEFGVIAEAFPQETRLYLEETLVEHWAELAAKGDWAALTTLSDRSMSLARQYQRQFEDRLSTSIHENLARHAAAQMVPADLITGLRSYVEGSRWLQTARPAQAESPLTIAVSTLSRFESPLAAQAAILLSEIPSLQGDLQREAALLLPAIEQAAQQGWLNAQARGHNRRALLHYRQGDLQSSLRDRLTALSIYRRTKDPDRITALEATAGDNHRYIGDYPRVWAHAVASLKASRSARQSSSRHMALLYASLAAEDERLPFAARALQTELINQGRRLHQANDLVIGLEGRARSALMLGRLDEADRDISEGMQWLEKMPDPVNRERNALELAETGALVWAARGAHDSESRIDAAISYLNRQNYRTRLSPLLQARADLRLRKGDIAGAEDDLAEAQLIVEQQRDRLDRAARRGHLDSLRPIASKRASVAYQRKDFDQVLSYLELGRARVLMDAAPASAAFGDRPLPDSTAVLYYSATELAVVAVIRAHRVEIVPISCADSEIASQIAGIARIVRLRSSASAGETHLRRLHHCLVAPLISHLVGVRKLVIVPDGLIRLVPFAALLDAQSFLVERYEVSYAPSLRWLSGAQSTLDPEPSVTAIGDPELPEHVQSTWPRLPFAKSETDAVYALYGQGLKGVGTEATPALFEDGLKRTHVVHVAAHAVFHEARPERSHLLLAADADGRFQITSEDLWKLAGVQARVVVLAGCDTGLADSSRAEGLSALSEPLLAAGVQSVVVSLWPVDDRHSGGLMLDMHRALKDHRTGGQALSAAQRTAISADRNAWLNWAAFIVFSA